MPPDPERTARQERTYFRAVNIRDGLANGFWLPIIRRLTHEHMPEALTLLADHESADRPARAHLGYRRAWRLGSALGAYNRAIDAFNRRQLATYRHWLRRAADAGDVEARDQIRRFETRLPHADARRIGRHRPYRRAELR